MHHLLGMAEIAEILGVTRQRVAQLIETYEDFPEPEIELTGGRVWSRTAVESWIASHPERGPGRSEEKKPRFFGRQSGAMFERFTDRARAAVVKGQEEARLMNHNFIGTEHLLLGLLAIGEGVAFEALDSLGVKLEAVRSQVEKMIGRGPESPMGHIPFTPRAKKVLERSLREALDLGHNYIGTEHMLFALVREVEGVAAQALVDLDAPLHRVRDRVGEILKGFAPARPKAERGQLLACSFCGKKREDVQRIIAGPNVFICNECVENCNEILQEQGIEWIAAHREHGLRRRIDDLERRLEELEGRD